MATTALFTTTPTREITPPPVMMMPKRVAGEHRHQSTPMSDGTTDTMMVAVWIAEVGDSDDHDDEDGDGEEPLKEGLRTPLSWFDPAKVQR